MSSASQVSALSVRTMQTVGKSVWWWFSAERFFETCEAAVKRSRGSDRGGPSECTDQGTDPEQRPSFHYLDRNHDGHVDVKDIFESSISGVREEGYVAEKILSGRSKPLFVALQIVVALALWAIFAAKNATAERPMMEASGGLDDLCGGECNLRVTQDCNDLRHEVWRWLTYQWSHSHFVHIFCNCVTVFIFGIPMEGVHGTRRMILMFNLGVVGGAMATFWTDVHTAVQGMSGGGYALIGLHAADLMLNWNSKQYRKPTLVMIVALIGLDVLLNVTSSRENISHAAHVGGGVTGVLIGLIVGKNFKWTQKQHIVRVAAASVACLLVVTTLVWLFAVSSPPRDVNDDVAWCWARQVFDHARFGNRWRCVRCADQTCIHGWLHLGTGFIEEVDWRVCMRQNDWVE